MKWDDLKNIYNFIRLFIQKININLKTHKFKSTNTIQIFKIQPKFKVKYIKVNNHN